MKLGNFPDKYKDKYENYRFAKIIIEKLIQTQYHIPRSLLESIVKLN